MGDCAPEAMSWAALDHVGPMASTMAGIAKLLSIIAGYDAHDTRQQGKVAPGLDTNYMPALERGVDGLKIAIWNEGFGQDNSDYGLISSEPETANLSRLAFYPKFTGRSSYFPNL
ncbi:Amidase [Pandoraea terrae]|uniref:Amidase n=2 Tax=Pandoraea terrae TaxID=1537710 RepID=A0A5E4U8J6_9BURK|nr:Amidase [Pandoraea terrae]